MLKIRQPPSVSLNGVYSRIRAQNPTFDIGILVVYYDLAPHFGIDPAVAVAQAVLETGWFRSEGATKYHNYCGLGTTDGNIGFESDSIALGVLAHLSHLQRYVSSQFDPLCNVADPRYDLIASENVGSAVYVDDLGGSGKWNPDPRYGYNIWQVYIELGGQ